MAVETFTIDVGAREQVASVVAIVQRHLQESRQLKRTGKVIFEIGLRDGGVTSKIITTQHTEK